MILSSAFLGTLGSTWSHSPHRFPPFFPNLRSTVVNSTTKMGDRAGTTSTDSRGSTYLSVRRDAGRMKADSSRLHDHRRGPLICIAGLFLGHHWGPPCCLPRSACSNAVAAHGPRRRCTNDKRTCCEHSFPGPLLADLRPVRPELRWSYVPFHKYVACTNAPQRIPYCYGGARLRFKTGSHRGTEIEKQRQNQVRACV